MVKEILCIGLLWLASLGAFAAQTGDRNYGIIPAPKEITANGSDFTVGVADRLYIRYSGEEALKDAGFLNAFLQENCGVTAVLTEKKVPAKAYVIQMDGNYSGNEEGYTLKVSGNNITLSGNGAGLFYAVQSLQQLILYNDQPEEGFTVPGVEIKDEPRFGYRGIMQESGYHIYPISFVKQEIDYLARYKMNVYHWHLTEDEGWRIESKKFPRLNEISSWRDQTWIENYDHDFRGLDGVRYGGYYTQDEIKEVVRYAQDRHVTIIPEVELPGHTSAVLAAYPSLGCTGGPYVVEPYWGIFEDVFCAGREETFHFLEELLDEVMELFPGKYFHIGGDECPKDRWSKCPFCQQRIKDEGLADEFELQSYFIKRIEKYLNSKGRQIIGWDEIREGGLAPSATVMNWREPIEGILSAKEGHDVINACNEWLYFDHLQDIPTQEPLGIGGYLPTEKVYDYDPMYPELTTEEEKKHVIGVEAPLWTEFVETERKFAYMLYPRMFALSEMGWSPQEVKDHDNFFTDRLPAHLGQVDSEGLMYRVPNPKGLPEMVQRGGEFTMELFCPVKGARIYYNFDGQTPRETDYLYDGPVKLVVPEGTMRKVNAIVITPSGKRSTVSTAIYDNRHGTEYLVGTATESIEPGNDIFSQALAGYGAPVEGRFSIRWEKLGKAADFAWTSDIDDQQHISADGPDGAVVSTAEYKGRIIALTENNSIWRKDIADKKSRWVKIGFDNGLTYTIEARRIAVKDNRLYAIDAEGDLYRNFHGTKNNMTARATAFSKDGQTVIIVGLDVTGFDYAFINSVKKDITAKTSVPAEAILINASHSHFVPVTQGWYAWHEPVQYPDDQYMEEVIRPAVVSAACRAVADLHPGYLYFGRTDSYIGGHRSLSGKDAYYDPSVDVVEVVNKDNELENIIFRAGCHPVFDDTDDEAYYTISGNFPAIAKDLLQATLGTENAMFLQGCAGDVNPLDQTPENTAAVLAGSVMDCIKDKMQTVDGEISYALDSVLFETTPWNMKDLKAFREESAKHLDDLGEARNYRWADIQIKRLESKTMPKYMPVYVQTLNIGDWKIVALSREAVGRYGLAIRNIWPGSNVTVLGYSNDVSSYLPSIEHIKAGTYEGNDSFLWYSQPNVFPENVLDVITSEIRKNNR